MTQPITYKGWRLTDAATGKPVAIGDRITSSTGEVAQIHGAVAPHRPGTSGKLWTEEHGALYYVGVWGLRWVSAEGRWFGDGKGT
jgi:hypothetical protein